MVDGFDYDYVIIEDDEFTIIKGGNEYTYDVDSHGFLIDGARSNGVPVIDEREWQEWSEWDSEPEYDESSRGEREEW